MTAIIPGVIGSVRVLVVAVDSTASTAGVRVLDLNGSFLTPAATIPLGVITAVEVPVAVGDVMEKVQDGLTAVVRWVDPTNPTRWSPSASGMPAQSSLGWRKIGTFALS